MTEFCLVSVLVSMETVSVPAASNSTNVTNGTTLQQDVEEPVKVCWSWGADSDGQDCPMDLYFTTIIFTTLAIVACLVPAILHCLRHGNCIHQNTCLCASVGCDILSFSMPLFFSIVAALLSIVYIGLVLEDNRVNESTPGQVDLSREMLKIKPWRMGLTSLACLLSIMSCIFAGMLAARWRLQQAEDIGHLQSRPIARQRPTRRSNLKSSLYVSEL